MTNIIWNLSIKGLLPPNVYKIGKNNQKMTIIKVKPMKQLESYIKKQKKNKKQKKPKKNPKDTLIIQWF